MADLKIPNLNKNSDKYFFKKKLSLRRKSKSKLINESFIMIFFSALIFYLIYLIPNKISIFKNLLVNFSKLFANVLDSISYIYEICLSIFIVFSLCSIFLVSTALIYVYDGNDNNSLINTKNKLISIKSSNKLL